MSSAQRRVLEWLLAYPGVYVTARIDGYRVGWSHRWASERWRQNMVGVTADLGMDNRDTAPRAAPLDGPTPPITRPTFAVLQRNGWLRLASHWRGTARYTISRAGILTLREIATEVRP